MNIENNTTLIKALEELNKIVEALNKIEYEDYVSSGHEWIITEEDDVLDPWRNEKRLQEGMDAVDWSAINTCNIIYCETSIQHNQETIKRRPMLALYKTGSAESPTVYGMQITTVAPSESGMRSKFKYELKDWTQVGLKMKSYVNYDHLVKNMNDEVRITNHAKITQRDAKGLLADIEKNYDDLIRLGYSSSYDKELLDNFIAYLKKC